MSKAIRSRRFDGVTCVLAHKSTGDIVPEGAELSTDRGQVYTLRGGRAPHKPGSSGRVWVIGGGNEEWSSELFPHVFDLEWRPIGVTAPTCLCSGGLRHMGCPVPEHRSERSFMW